MLPHYCKPKALESVLFYVRITHYDSTCRCSSGRLAIMLTHRSSVCGFLPVRRQLCQWVENLKINSTSVTISLTSRRLAVVSNLNAMINHWVRETFLNGVYPVIDGSPLLFFAVFFAQPFCPPRRTFSG